MTQSVGHVGRKARRVCRIKDLATTKGKPGLLPVSPATVWRWIKEGKFPAPFKLGPNTTVFDLDRVEAFLAQQAGGGDE
jgi:prophage regulatory protein